MRSPSSSAVHYVQCIGCVKYGKVKPMWNCLNPAFSLKASRGRLTQKGWKWPSKLDLSAYKQFMVSLAGLRSSSPQHIHDPVYNYRLPHINYNSKAIKQCIRIYENPRGRLQGLCRYEKRTHLFYPFQSPSLSVPSPFILLSLVTSLHLPAWSALIGWHQSCDVRKVWEWCKNIFVWCCSYQVINFLLFFNLKLILWVFLILAKQSDHFQTFSDTLKNGNLWKIKHFIRQFSKVLHQCDGKKIQKIRARK